MRLNKTMFAALGAMTIISMSAVPAMAEGTSTNAAAASFKPAKATEGTMIYSDGKRIGQVIGVRANGDAQIVISGKAYLVPAETLYEKDGKLATSLSRAEVVRR